ncbi:MAG TPA: ABC transporter substrate-binding protein [Planctomycetota bacterium]|nr:ABC transporter substrate-binding protein [Planctomycetota bacterium]
MTDLATDSSRRKFIGMALAAGAVVVAGGVGYVLFSPGGGPVGAVCYCSLDQEFSVDLFARFKSERGLDVLPLYDAESQKTVGLANRLVSEKAHPQCDVFWNNEILQTVRLANLGLFESYASPAAADLPPGLCDPQHRWHGYAARARCFLVNNKLVPAGSEPKFLSDLTNATWKDRVAIAKPVAGTTASHFAVLRTLWGVDRFKAFVTALKANGVQDQPGNMDSAKAAAEGRVAVALADTDDCLVLIGKGADCRIEFPGQSPEFPGSLLIPTTVALIAGAPHPAEARRLIDTILDRSTEQALADGPAGQMPVRAGMRPPKGLEKFNPQNVLVVDWNQVALLFDENQRYMIEQFA